MQNNVLDALVDALAPALAKKMGVKGATGTPTTIYAHGPGGLFSTCGLDQDVISTVVRPTGLLEYLPAFPTVFMNPLFSYVTGFLADTGDEAATVCDNCKTAGLKKACVQTAQFGRYCRETRELSVERIMQRVNRGEPDDLRLLNPVMGDNIFTSSRVRQNLLASEVQQALVEVGVAFERLLTPQVWQGNPANNNIGGGYLEFPGLDILIGTGKIDAISGTSCPSLDSDVKDYNYQDVCFGTPSIVEVLTYLYRYVSKNARTMGMEPVDFRWAMREELFYELTSCWPCSYLTFRCTSNADSNVVPSADSADAIKLRDDMREGRYLIVDGKRIPVVLDDGIAEDTNTTNANLNAGEFASDIYLLPMSVKGSFASLYLEYLDFSKGSDDIALARMQDIYQVTDAGKFLWIKDWVRGCFLLQGVIRPRIILKTPHLAGRVQNVKYTPLQHTRQPFPDDGYFKNGGVTYRDAPSYYSEWDRYQ